MGEDILRSLDRYHDALHTQMNVLEASSERRSKLVQDGVSQLQSNLQEQTDQLHGHFLGQNKESRSCRLDGTTFVPLLHQTLSKFGIGGAIVLLVSLAIFYLLSYGKLILARPINHNKEPRSCRLGGAIVLLISLAKIKSLGLAASTVP